MFFTITFYIAISIFVVGTLYRVSAWFRLSLIPESKRHTPGKRIFTAVKGMLSVVFSRKILAVLKVFFLDVLFQVRALRQSFLRWLMHMLIYGGFMLLLLMHALDGLITERLFTGYYSTLNPFMFLRNLFGAMVLIGIGIAIYRRFFLKLPRLKTNIMDHYAIIILAIIMVSGILLEGLKISSYSAFQQMVEDYAGLDDTDEVRALESYWVHEFGVVSPNVNGAYDEQTLAVGRELHEMSCIECHAAAQSAFVGYAAAGIIRPAALSLDQAGFVDLMWYIHFLACFLGLAYLPFSKMFHMVAGPVSLLANAVMDKDRSDPANLATKQIMELDACTHCGACTLRCAVGMAYEQIPNENILPSEKILSLKILAAGKILSAKDLRLILEGLYLCTNCRRCTEVCPVGINLHELWSSVREALLQRGYPELLVLSPLSLYRGLMSAESENGAYRRPIESARGLIANIFRPKDMDNDPLKQAHRDPSLQELLGISLQSKTFAYCFNCTTCTNACPVMHNYNSPRQVLGMVPHQIIHAAAWGLSDLIFSSKMLWACLGCYMCQEQCPQGVRVADVFYELKNLAISRAKDKTTLS